MRTIVLALCLLTAPVAGHEARYVYFGGHPLASGSVCRIAGTHTHGEAPGASFENVDGQWVFRGALPSAAAPRRARAGSGCPFHH